MKRILPFLLILALILVQLPHLFVVEARAASSDDAGWIELLDYGGPNGTDSYFYTLSSGNNSVKFLMPTIMIPRYVDIIFTCQDGSLGVFPSVFQDYFKGPIALTCVHVTGNIYRAYGSFTAEFADHLKLIFNAQYDYYVNFISVRVTSSNVFVEDLPFSADFSIDGTHKLSLSYPDNPIGTVSTSGGFGTLYTAYFDLDTWRYVDRFDIIVGLSVSSIDSISLMFNGGTLPLEYQYISSDIGGEHDFILSLSADLSGVDRSSGDTPCIVISGYSNTPATSGVSIGYNFFTLYSSCGYLSTPSLDPDVYYSKIMIGYIKEIFSGESPGNQSVLSAISDAADKIAAAFSAGLASTGEGEVVKLKGSQIGGEISAGQAQLDSVNKPSGVDITAVDSLGAVGFTGNTTYLTQIVNTPYIKDVFVFVAILAVVSLVLFGSKKGG